MSERFRPRIVASYSASHIREIKDWVVSLADDVSVEQAMESLGWNEKKKHRLTLGMRLLVQFIAQDREIDEVREALVWQRTPPPAEGFRYTVEWKFYNPRFMDPRIKIDKI